MLQQFSDHFDVTSERLGTKCRGFFFPKLQFLEDTCPFCGATDYDDTLKILKINNDIPSD